MTIKALKRKLGTAYLELVKTFPLAPIQDEQHLTEAQAVLDDLLRRNLDIGEEAYLDVLTELVRAYEDQHHPMPAVSEAAMLQHLIEAKGVSQAQVARDTHIAASTISEVLTGARELSKRHIKTLAGYFHVSPAVFLNQD